MHTLYIYDIYPIPFSGAPTPPSLGCKHATALPGNCVLLRRPMLDAAYVHASGIEDPRTLKLCIAHTAA